MDDSLARLAGQAAVEDFLPVLAYRYARERLMSLSRPADRPAGSWDVVFVSLSGGGRGQLAAGLTAALSGGAVSVHAAGSDAGPGLDPEVARALEEVGVEVAESYARPVSDEVLGAADVIVTMGRSVGSFPRRKACGASTGGSATRAERRPRRGSAGARRHRAAGARPARGARVPRQRASPRATTTQLLVSQPWARAPARRVVRQGPGRRRAGRGRASATPSAAQ